MIRGLIVVLFFLGCTSINNQEDIDSKSALVIGHFQTIEHSFIPDSTNKVHISFINGGDPVPCGTICENTKTQCMHEFVRGKMGDCTAVYFSKADNINKVVIKLPFSQSVTRYNGEDSSRLYIDSIVNNDRIHIRFIKSAFHIDAGDTMKVIDTLTIRPDSNYCLQRIIITHKIINYGVSVLPDKRFIEFF